MFWTVVRSEIKDEDALICTLPRIAEYYLPEANISKINEALNEVQDSKVEVRDLRLKEGQRRIWFVLDEPTMKVVDPNYRMRKWIQGRSRLMKRFPVYTRASDRSVSVFLAENLDSLSVP